MDRKTFEKGMTVLAKTFPDRIKDTIVFWTFLKDLSNEQFITGLTELITTKEEVYPGTNLIAVIRKKAKEDTEQLTAGEAWGEVCNLCRSVGSNGMPTFSSPIISKAVSSMGWKYLCFSENEVADRAHFISIYNELLEKYEITQKQIPDSERLLSIPDTIKMLSAERDLAKGGKEKNVL